MSGSSGFSVTIKAVDQTTGTLDSINKRLAKLSAPADRFSKAMSRFGDVSGINRVSEGFGSLGRTAHDAFMSIDRVSGPLAAITGAASIAGVVALTSRWAELGSTIGRTGFRLALPVEQLSAVQGAGRRFGATADQVTQSLSGLRETLYGAAWGRDPAAVQALMAIDKNLVGTPGHVTDTMKAFDEIADRVAGEKDVHTKLRIMASVGIDQNLLPLLNLGSKGVHAEMQRQADLGGTVTDKMTADAIKTQQSFTDLGTAIGGVANRLGNELGKATEGWAEKLAKLIGGNQDLADSYTKIGLAITGVMALKPVGFIARLLGWTALGEAASLTAGIGAPLLAAGAAAGYQNAPMTDDFGRVVGNWGGRDESANPGAGGGWNPFTSIGQWWNGRSTAPAITAPRAPTAAAATMRRMHDYFRAKGLDEEQTAGVLSNASAESGFDPTKWGDGGTSYGIFQTHADRLARMQTRYGTQTPSEQQQLDFAWDELNTSKRSTLDAIRGVHRSDQSAAIFSSGFEVPRDGPVEAFRRGQGAPQFVQHDAAPGFGADGQPLPNGWTDAGSTNGHVQVDVHLHGATTGTKAKVTSSGNVTAPPPKIETPMPMVN